MPNGPMMAPPVDDEEIESTEPETDDMEAEDTKSALLPKSIFSGEVKPGDTITLTVNQVFGDEVEVSVGGEKPGQETKPSSMTADEEIEAASKEIM